MNYNKINVSLSKALKMFHFFKELWNEEPDTFTEAIYTISLCKGHSKIYLKVPLLWMMPKKAPLLKQKTKQKAPQQKNVHPHEQCQHYLEPNCHGNMIQTDRETGYSFPCPHSKGIYQCWVTPSQFCFIAVSTILSHELLACLKK